VVELKVHLGEGLLQVRGVDGGQPDQAVAVPEEGADGADRLRGAEGAAEAADGVEVREPLTMATVVTPQCWSQVATASRSCVNVPKRRIGCGSRSRGTQT
jgi:hypothetical protein